MGIYDRDYTQDEGGPPQPLKLRWPQTAVSQIILLCVGIVILDAVGAVMINVPESKIAKGAPAYYHFMTDTMAATPHTLVSPWLWWQLLTSGFAHSTRTLTHVAFNMFGLWILGREVETKYGRGEFWRIYLVAIVLGTVFWCARNGLTDPDGLKLGFDNTISKVLGASGAVTAIIMLFILNFPQQQLLLLGQIPIKAWVLGVIMLVMNLFPVKIGPEEQKVAYDVHLVGAAFAAAYFYAGLNFGNILGLGSKRRWKRKPKLKVHNPDADEVDYSQQNELADSLLDKVRDYGEESLTANERKVLEDYSRRMRQKHR